jgi:hypothetical protein
VRETAWGCDWIGTPVPFQRCLVFIMFTANKEFTLTAGKFVSVCNKTMMNVRIFTVFGIKSERTRLARYKCKDRYSCLYIINVIYRPFIFHEFITTYVYIMRSRQAHIGTNLRMPVLMSHELGSLQGSTFCILYRCDTFLSAKF